ncbi:Cof-type HAD-IIB family hydrolase [Clostridium estertheticum]|uniref:Cof-type HAD-IIB family hydrolase n=1 Tax=Clostridium estertheticum TaxID=238834 RepID=A0AA47EEJ5_9CLOT|nr:Cof-type HAD-IIB family hydrolase [Clostridium estertheticum]MBU3154853.1 Cof-type HAD-IIB family hydrolase [Clostridium estertheticum]WAG58682.1 Cof-type HAD-IIB family hydrolase [Clostridium estertheticum]
MNKIKMICLDIDGTLLNSEHKISKKTKEVIEIVANKKQIPVILVSARMPKGILFLQKELNIEQPIICYSGALVMDKDANILSNCSIEVSDVRQVHNFVKEIGVHMSLYKDDEWYIEEIDEWSSQESEITNISPKVINFTDLFNVWEQEKSGPNKLLCMAEPDKIKALDLLIKSYHSNNLNIYPSKPTYLEIMPNNVSKTSAIEILMSKFNIQRSEIIAIGDNYNDISMIEFAGVGVAMGNAPEGVKQYADYITSTNDEDGVAMAIKKYIIS